MIMKRLINSLFLLVLVLTFTSCEDFLIHEPSNSVSDVTAFKTAQDVDNALSGVYYSLGRNTFYGRDYIGLGDIAADNCYMLGGTGHFDQIYKYTVNIDNGDILNIWDGGYKTIDRAARLIKAAKPMLSSNLSATDNAKVSSAIGEAYAIKALSHFALVNVFGLPYNDANKTKLGVVIVGDEPIVAFEPVTRGTIEATYAQILADIASAKGYAASLTTSKFKMNEAAIYALEARVRLFMKDYPGAITAANTAISKRAGGLVKVRADYFAMWGSLNITSEDIFTISKLSNDNLSANSLNTLYGSYQGKATSGLYGLYGANDMRLQLFSVAENYRPLKYMGLPSSAATSNIPVLRLPEMYLILAEAKAELAQADAVDAVFEVASRNPDLVKASIPTDKAGLLSFISAERRRELFQEGHRWFDIRRTGEIMTRVGGNFPITNWDASKFVYPIPSQEVNASGIQQNDGWNNFLPN